MVNFYFKEVEKLYQNLYKEIFKSGLLFLCYLVLENINNKNYVLLLFSMTSYNVASQIHVLYLFYRILFRRFQEYRIAILAWALVLKTHNFLGQIRVFS